jgi:hypothetical protein
MYSIAVRQYAIGAGVAAHDYLVMLDDQGNIVKQFHGLAADATTGEPISGAVGRSNNLIKGFEYGQFGDGPYNQAGQAQTILWQGSQQDAEAKW